MPGDPHLTRDAAETIFRRGNERPHDSSEIAHSTSPHLAVRSLVRVRTIVARP
jgi:hypothetical protein